MSKGSNDAVIAKLEQAANEPVFLYQYAAHDGMVFRFSGNQTADILFNGYIWKAAPITHGPIETAQDSRVDETTVTAAGLSSDLVSYLTQGDVSINGDEMTILKIFRDALDDPTNYVLEFFGEIDGPAFDGNQIQLPVRRKHGTYAKVIPFETYEGPCPLFFKDPETCKYSGSDTVCNRTGERCIELGNIDNYGGFLWHPAQLTK